MKFLRWLHRVDKIRLSGERESKMRAYIPAPIASAAVAVLQPYCPELSPASLIEALKHRDQPQFAAINRKPLTRREVAEMLQISIASVNRRMKDGTLRAFKVGKRAVRIAPESVEALMQAAPATSLEA